MQRRILIAGHDLTIPLTLKTVLEPLGFEVLIASTYAEATALLDPGPLHMVITESRLEREDAGRELARDARAMPYDPAVAVLTATPLFDSRYGLDAESEGHTLVQPMNTPDLVRQIEALLITHEDVKQRRMKKASRAASHPSQRSAGQA